jgi:hypothetical protein
MLSEYVFFTQRSYAQCVIFFTAIHASASDINTVVPTIDPMTSLNGQDIASCFNITVTETMTFTATLTPSPSIDLTTSLSGLDPTSCYNITVTETETMTNNFTAYVPATTFSYIHSLLTTTLTTIAPTTVVMTTYLAPSTVTVEMTPSLNKCHNETAYINITNTKYIQEAVENITKALYVDKTTTSSYIRSKTCAEDNRTSSATLGYFGIIFISVPFGIMVLADLCAISKQIVTRAKLSCVSPDRNISTEKVGPKRNVVIEVKTGKTSSGS